MFAPRAIALDTSKLVLIPPLAIIVADGTWYNTSMIAIAVGIPQVENSFDRSLITGLLDLIPSIITQFVPPKPETSKYSTPISAYILATLPSKPLPVSFIITGTGSSSTRTDTRSTSLLKFLSPSG